MKRWIPLLALLLSLFYLGGSWRPPGAGDGIDLRGFSKLPVLSGGRVKPMDTVARNSLLIITGKQVLRLPEGKVDASHWLATVLFEAGKADAWPAFLVDNPEVLGLCGFQQEGRRRFSFDELKPYLPQIDEQGSQAGEVESAKRSPYQTAVMNLRNALMLYQRLKASIQPEGATGFVEEIESYTGVMPAGFQAMRDRRSGDGHDQEALATFTRFLNRFQPLTAAYLRPVPPPAGETEWETIGGALLGVQSADELNPVVRAYAALGDAFRAGDTAAFSAEVETVRGLVAAEQPDALKRSAFEHLFNHVQPFYHAMVLCVLGFLAAFGSWLIMGWGRELRRAGFLILVVALLVMTFGMVARIYLQGRPPVTNLYSSAIFIGWGAVVLGLVLERIFKDGLGTVCAGAVGFLTLIIAHHLAGSGDTLQMLQAVLATNIWLATHVVVITLGYTAMFFAGVLAIIYVVRGRFSRSLEKADASRLQSMVYGVICFATLFSFVGTVLGGIWADQSWGRFWGWDPKENGALLIVLWCAIILHARWGGYIRQRGLMIMAICGNIITSFSWFGVNMLGVGLHSYGFMNKAFPWLIAFIVSQVVLMAVAGARPLKEWRSFRGKGA